MKKALMKLILRLAIALALWAMNDRTKAKISRGMAEKIADLYRAMMAKVDRDEKQQSSPDNAQPEPARPWQALKGVIGRVLRRDGDGRDGGGKNTGRGVPLDD